MKSTTIEEQKSFFFKYWMDSPLIPDVKQKHVEIDALIPIDLNVDLNELFHET